MLTGPRVLNEEPSLFHPLPFKFPNLKGNGTVPKNIVLGRYNPDPEECEPVLVSQGRFNVCQLPGSDWFNEKGLSVFDVYDFVPRHFFRYPYEFGSTSRPLNNGGELWERTLQLMFDHDRKSGMMKLMLKRLAECQLVEVPTVLPQNRCTLCDECLAKWYIFQLQRMKKMDLPLPPREEGRLSVLSSRPPGNRDTGSSSPKEKLLLHGYPKDGYRKSVYRFANEGPVGPLPPLWYGSRPFSFDIGTKEGRAALRSARAAEALLRSTIDDYSLLPPRSLSRKEKRSFYMLCKCVSTETPRSPGSMNHWVKASKDPRSRAGFLATRIFTIMRKQH